MKAAVIIVVVCGALALLGMLLSSSMGSGAFKRMTTVGGVYAVCKPESYPFICFLDADSDEGGLSCQPYTGECRK